MTDIACLHQYIMIPSSPTPWLLEVIMMGPVIGLASVYVIGMVSGCNRYGKWV